MPVPVLLCLIHAATARVLQRRCSGTGKEGMNASSSLQLADSAKPLAANDKERRYA